MSDQVAAFLFTSLFLASMAAWVPVLEFIRDAARRRQEAARERPLAWKANGERRLRIVASRVPVGPAR